MADGVALAMVIDGPGPIGQSTYLDSRGLNNPTDGRRVLVQPQLLQDLSAFCRAAGFEPSALQEVGSDGDLTTPVLQQSILLREAVRICRWPCWTGLLQRA